ncbi:MAG TPA: NifU family protein [Acidobacteriota bacterium]|nr:NifU family protein [Acidobacteriota bacterium]HNC46398.1 NifU family protein [Acidobacteriota bacterium]HNH83857.1 NifU family protein [Acidobacteriota bacterium]
MPKIEDIEYTPNPNARKIILKEPLTAPGVSHSFATPAEAASDPLAESLFTIPHVKSVFIMDRFVTITKDNEIGWDELLRQVAIPIRAAASIAAQVPAGPAFLPGLNPKLDQINEILDLRIRPGLAGDGGGLQIMGLEGKTLSVRYQGACGSCPSSISGTLYAIQHILRSEVDPELEVIAV